MLQFVMDQFFYGLELYCFVFFLFFFFILFLVQIYRLPGSVAEHNAFSWTCLHVDPKCLTVIGQGDMSHFILY